MGRGGGPGTPIIWAKSPQTFIIGLQSYDLDPDIVSMTSPMVSIQYRNVTDRRTDRDNSTSIVNYQKFPKKEVMKLPTVFDDKNAHFLANKTKSAKLCTILGE